MKKISAIFVLLVFITLPLTSASETFTEETICGPNDIDCQRPKMDVVFVIDSTGSMHDEIRTIKEFLINIVDEIENGYPKPDVKVGVVVYRDYPNQEREYLYKKLDLTSDPNKAVEFIKDIEAIGGGDYEEAVEAGLDVAINKLNWRSNAKKVMLLIGDAPPKLEPYHNNYGNFPEYYEGESYLIQERQYTYKDAIKDANGRQITIYTAAGSGMNHRGIQIWKEIAKGTGGSFIELEYQVKDLDQYYIEESIPGEFLAEAKASRDYDATDNTIVTNNAGGFAKAVLKKEAESIGVEYENPFDEITGEATRENKNIFVDFWETIKSFLSF